MFRGEARLELEILERELADHGGAVLAGLRRAVDAFAGGAAPALDAEAFDDRARAAHARIDAAASRLLAERWEVSAEARRAVAARRVNDALEGVAELALAIARLAQPAGAAAARAGDELDALARLVQGTMHEAMRAYAFRSVTRANAVIGADARVEDAVRRATAVLAARAGIVPDAGGWALRALLVARMLRRVAEQGTRIASQVAGTAGGPAPDSSPAGSACPAS